MRIVMLVACAMVSLGCSAAQADDVQKARERAKICDKAAAEKQLGNEEQHAFIKACLASEGAATAPGEPSKAADREKRCATVATSKTLTGAERDAFMKSCLAGNAS